MTSSIISTLPCIILLYCFSGVPVLIIGVTLAVSVDKYKAEDHCWLNVKNGTIWAFVGPVVFVLVVCSHMSPLKYKKPVNNLYLI